MTLDESSENDRPIPTRGPGGQTFRDGITLISLQSGERVILIDKLRANS